MESTRAGCQRYLVVLCAVLACEVSCSEPSSSSFPSDATHVTIICFGSMAGAAGDGVYCGVFSLGEASPITRAGSSENSSESGLLALLLRLSAVGGDLNGDGRVDFRDLFLLQRFYQRILLEDPQLASGDLDRNSVIDQRDFFQFMRLWHQVLQSTHGGLRIGDCGVVNKATDFRAPRSTFPSRSGGSER